MSERTAESRHLPASHARRLEALEAGPQVFDGRSTKWIGVLQETQFVDAEITKEKGRTTIKAELTPRGKTALERNRRGVDPYLVMTE
jgi:DNA-binding PadR family transcriptional regulator